MSGAAPSASGGTSSPKPMAINLLALGFACVLLFLFLAPTSSRSPLHNDPSSNAVHDLPLLYLSKAKKSLYRPAPKLAKNVWTELDAMVVSEHQRNKLPWRFRVHNSMVASFGHTRILQDSRKVCKVPNMEVQVDNPFRAETNIGKMKRCYVCLRFDRQCRGQDMEELWDRRYFKKYDTYSATFLMTDTTALNRLKRDDLEKFEEVMFTREGEMYVSALDGGDAISGNKAKQLSVKRGYAEQFGCDYNTLRIQPAQYTMHHPKECRSFFAAAEQMPKDTMWIMKPVLGSGGVGISLHTGLKDFQEQFSNCPKPTAKDPNLNKFIIQEYVKHPLLIHNKKFDMRVYMLIASSNPYIIFFHKGYLRRAVFNYDSSSTTRTVFLTNTHFQSLEKDFELADHIWGWARFQKYLADHNVAGSQYISTVLDSAIKKVMLFNFWSAKSELKRRKGTYHLFGLDFMIDDELRVHFIEANGFPGYTWSKDFPTRKMVGTMIDMIVELHEAPTGFERMTRGDMYGEFEMIYNELEDGCSDVAYDPCIEFSTHNRQKMKDSAKKIAQIHDTGRRTMFKAKKQKQRDATQALEACKAQGLSTESSACKQVLLQERRKKFVAMFQEIRAWNAINKFVSGM